MSDDTSISRKHASFFITNGVLSVQDTGSKYGTFVKSISGELEKLKENPQVLNDGDCVRFGIFNDWNVHQNVQKSSSSTSSSTKRKSSETSNEQTSAVLNTRSAKKDPKPTAEPVTKQNDIRRMIVDSTEFSEPPSCSTQKRSVESVEMESEGNWNVHQNEQKSGSLSNIKSSEIVVKKIPAMFNTRKTQKDPKRETKPVTKNKIQQISLVDSDDEPPARSTRKRSAASAQIGSDEDQSAHKSGNFTNQKSSDIVYPKIPAFNTRSTNKDPKPVTDPVTNKKIQQITLDDSDDEPPARSTRKRSAASAELEGDGDRNVLQDVHSNLQKSVSLSKRKCSETSDTQASELSNTRTRTTKKDPKPASKPIPKRNKIHLISDEDSDDNAGSTRSTQKRSSSEMGSDGGLFAFKLNFGKKVRKNQNESQEAPTVTGIVPLQTPRQAPVKQFSSYRDDDDSCDSGVWLCKKMIKIEINDSVDGIKSEVPEPDSCIDTQDIKPEQYVSLFNVLETSAGFNSTASIVSKRKQFVKKKNYKSQSNVVTMKAFRVEETYLKLDDF